MSLSSLGGHWISKGMTGSGCNRVRGWSASKRDDPRCIYSGGMWFAARDIQVPDLNLSYPASLPSPTPLIHPSSATLPSESSHGLFSRTLECTFRSRLRIAHSWTNLHGEIHKRGHDEDYPLYADYHGLRENRGSSFRIFHEWHYRGTQPEMKAREKYIEEVTAKFNILKNYSNWQNLFTMYYHLKCFQYYYITLYLI